MCLASLARRRTTTAFVLRSCAFNKSTTKNINQRPFRMVCRVWGVVAASPVCVADSPLDVARHASCCFNMYQGSSSDINDQAPLQRLDRGLNVRGRLQQILNSHQRVRGLPICLGKRHAALSSRECPSSWGSTESKQKVQHVAIAYSCSSRSSCFKAYDLRLAYFQLFSIFST